MDEREPLSRLIGDIYDAALDPTLWSSVLEKSAGFVGGTASGLFLKDFIRKTQNNIYLWGYDPEFTRSYMEKYISLDPFTTGQVLFEAGQPICLADIVPHHEFRMSRFYLEWVKPQGWIDAIVVNLEKSATSYAAFSVIRHEDDGIVDDETRRRAKLIAPHVQRAVLIGKVVDSYKIEAAALADACDGLAAAMFLVDSGGRIVHANVAGHRLLGEKSVARIAAGKFAALDPTADRALHDLFINAEGGDIAIGTAGIAVPLLSTDGQRFVAHVLPLTSGARRKARTAYSAVAAVFVRKVGLNSPHPLEAISEAFKLTASEMRVLMTVVEFGGVPEVAPILGVSEATVKTHLQHIFAKTATKRQADLVKLVAGYMSPLGH